MRQKQEKNFYSVVQIARHEIGTAHKDFFFSAVPEIICSGVFQKTADYRSDPDVFTEPIDAWSEAADSPDKKVYFHPGLGSPVKFPNALVVHKGIHLEDQMSVSILFMQVDLTSDTLQNLVPESLGATRSLI